MDFLGNLRGLWMLVLLLFCMPSDGFQFPPVKPSEDNLKGICDGEARVRRPQSDQGSYLFNREITVNLLESQYRRCCVRYERREDTLDCLLEKWDTAFIMYCNRLEVAEPVQRDHCCEARDPLACFQTQSEE